MNPFERQRARTRTQWRRLEAWAPALALFILLVFAVRAGLPADAAVRGVLAVVLTQLLPGLLIWRSIRPIRGWWIEDIALGFSLGIVVSVAAQAVAGLVQQYWIAVAAGPLAAAILFVLPASRMRILAAETTPLPLGWGSAVGGMALLYLIPAQAFYRTVPLSWPSGFRATYVDIPFHQALVAQLAHRGPTEIPYVVGEPLQYHWFSHAWIAQVGRVASMPFDAALLRFLPPVITIMAVTCVAAAAVRISQRAWAGPLAALIAIAAGELDVFRGVRPGSLVTHLSPSASLSVPLVVGIVTLLACRWWSAVGPGSTAVLVLLAAGAAGMKGTALPVILAGAALASAVVLITRDPLRHRVVTDFGLLTGVMVAGLLLIFRGGAQGLGIDPVGATATFAVHLGLPPDFGETGMLATATLAALTFVGVLARGVGMVGLFVTPRERREPLPWMLLGTGLAGAVAVIVFSHPGRSQWYFLRNSAPVLAIGSATGMLVLFDRCRGAARELFFAGLLVGAIAARLPSLTLGPASRVESDGEVLVRAVAYLTVFMALVLGAAVTMASTMGDRARLHRSTFLTVIAVAILAASVGPGIDRLVQPGRLPPYNAPVEANERHAISIDQISAARWIRDNSRVDDIVVTNRHCAIPDWVNCDSRRFHLAAYTERRILVEGWAYTRSWAESPEVELAPAYKPFWDEETLTLNDHFLLTPDSSVASQLRDLGVRWIFIDKTVPFSRDLADYAVMHLETEWAQVYELRTSGGAS